MWRLGLAGFMEMNCANEWLENWGQKSDIKSVIILLTPSAEADM